MDRETLPPEPVNEEWVEQLVFLTLYCSLSNSELQDASTRRLTNGHGWSALSVQSRTSTSCCAAGCTDACSSCFLVETTMHNQCMPGPADHHWSPVCSDLWFAHTCVKSSTSIATSLGRSRSRAWYASRMSLARALCISPALIFSFMAASLASSSSLSALCSLSPDKYLTASVASWRSEQSGHRAFFNASLFICFGFNARNKCNDILMLGFFSWNTFQVSNGVEAR